MSRSYLLNKVSGSTRDLNADGKRDEIERRKNKETGDGTEPSPGNH